AGVDRSVHATGLLGSHVSERARNVLGWRRLLAFTRQLGRYAKTGEPHIIGGVYEEIGRLNVLVDEAVPVNLAQRSRQVRGQSPKAYKLERSAEAANQRRAPVVLEEERRCPAVVVEGQGSSCPARVQHCCQCIFVLEPRGAERRLSRNQCEH